jgi:hypothetical protein
VREEGEPAQHDPAAEQAGGDREDEDLDQAALDEGEFEGLEDPESLMRMNPVCIWATSFVIADPNLGRSLRFISPIELVLGRPRG